MLPENLLERIVGQSPSKGIVGVMLSFLSDRPVVLKIISSLLFVVLLFVGVVLAKYKPLWIDELQTQMVGIEKLSYTEIVQMRLKEGNISPLFYLVQKGICDVARYSSKSKEIKRLQQIYSPEWQLILHHIYSPKGQIILRINPNVFMSLSLVLIFYFFSRYYSLGVGVYSLLIALSSFMVWAYWAEARPYALWVFLTTVQSLLFLCVMRNQQPSRSLWRGLIITHWTMSLTIVFSMVQILSVSFLLWLLKEKNIKRHLWLTVFPCAICLFYYSHSPDFGYWFSLSPMTLLAENVSAERMGLLMMCLIYAGVDYVRRKKFTKTSLRESRDNETREEWRHYLALTIFMFLAAAAVITIFKINDTHGTRGFPITGRYFIYLVPIGVIATTLVSVKIFRSFKNNAWMLTNVVIILGGLLIMRALRTAVLIFEKGLF